MASAMHHVHQHDMHDEEHMNFESLKYGSKWTEADLNKFGIHYDTGPISPYSIFLKVQNGGHSPSLMGSKRSSFLLQYAKHVEKLQATFDEIFVLNQNSSELLEVRSLMNEYRRTRLTTTGSTAGTSMTSMHPHRPMDRSASQAANDDEMNEAAKPTDNGDCVNWATATNSGMEMPLEALDCLEEGKTCRRNEAKFIGTKVMNEIIRAQRSANQSQTEYLDMNFSESRLNIMRAIQRVDDFLDSLKSVLANALSLDQEKSRNTFVDFFQEFAEIFCVKLRCCGVKRFIKLGQLTVSCRSDLRFDFAPAEDIVENLDRKVVVHVTVAEVKQNVEKRDTGSIPPKKKLRSAETPQGSQSVASNSEKNESDVGSPDCLEFPPCLRGQHGIELLADLDKSCLEPTLTNSMVLGMTVEATFVRLTCLDIQHHEFKKIQEQDPQNVVKRTGTVYYTKAFDMLTRDGRKDLIFILRYLLLLSKNPSAKWLPRD